MDSSKEKHIIKFCSNLSKKTNILLLFLIILVLIISIIVPLVHLSFHTINATEVNNSRFNKNMI